MTFGDELRECVKSRAEEDYNKAKEFYKDDITRYMCEMRQQAENGLSSYATIKSLDLRHYYDFINMIGRWSKENGLECIYSVNDYEKVSSGMYGNVFNNEAKIEFRW